MPRHPSDPGLDHLYSDPAQLERAAQLEASAKELRDAATQLMHAQYFPFACERMRAVADKLDQVAIKIRAENA